jgi:formylglycine-generating enzyme required for sulfatase activity
MTTSIAPLSDLSTLGVARLRAEQADAAARVGLSAHFSDRLADGQPGPELAVIPPGRMTLGAGTDERRFGDLPPRQVEIAEPFAIGRYTVTAEDFDLYARATGFLWIDHLIRAEGRLPVINISGAQAADYAAWLSAQTGQRYRLPSEQEWEYAARAGGTSAYCFGDRLTCGEANIHTVQSPASPVKGWRRFLPICVPLNRGCEVGSYPANVWGLFEVHGNVWEFTADAWVGSVDELRPTRGTPPGDWIVTKGGSWFEGPQDARAAARKPRLRGEIDVNLGLRLVRELV